MKMTIHFEGGGMIVVELEEANVARFLAEFDRNPSWTHFRTNDDKPATSVQWSKVQRIVWS